ncbi:MAG TPA: methionyl-tRNA formyltransferase [Steroidobacteraceae bacterium]
MTALRVAFAGTPEFARTALQALLGSRHGVAGVFTRPDRPRGRGQRMSASPVKEAALAAGLPVSQPATAQDGAALHELKSWRADVLVVVAYGLILPQPLLDAARLGSVNIHASLLPRWRGAAPIQRAILAGDTQTGITLMRMEAALDAGPILLQRSVPIRATDTSARLHHTLAALGAQTLLEGLDALAEGALPPTPQSQEGVSYAAKIGKSEAAIDWGKSATEVDRQVRAFNPWPVAETRFEDTQLRILAARIYQDAAPQVQGAAPGTVVLMLEDAVVVQCGEGYLGLMQVQRAGRRPITAREFAGGRALLGKRLG